MTIDWRTGILGALAAFTILGAPPARAQSTPAASVTLDGKTNAAIAERAAVLLETRYVFPDRGANYAAALRRHVAQGDYAAIADPAALAGRMTADLQAVAPDGHLRVYRMMPAPPSAAAPAGPIAAAGDRSPAPGIRDMRWIAPGVAYLSFDRFDDRPEAIAAVTGFLRDYASARALIIDSRGNHGGAFDMMGLLANHLFATPRLLANMDMSRAVVDQLGAPFPVDGHVLKRIDGLRGLVRFQHWSVPAHDAWSSVPVYYLTSRKTFSAAEHMAMVLKSTGRATLIGEATGGGNHFGGTEPIGGGLELFVPIGRTTDPKTGRDWESVGIAPDVAVPAGDALNEALRRIAAVPAPSS